MKTSQLLTYLALVVILSLIIGILIDLLFMPDFSYGSFFLGVALVTLVFLLYLRRTTRTENENLFEDEEEETLN